MPRKETIVQNDFSLGSPRPEAIERGDTDLIRKGSLEAENSIVLTTGALEQRPGTWVLDETSAKRGFEVDLGKGRVFDVHIVPNGVRVFSPTGVEIVSFLSTDWATLPSRYGNPSFDSMDFWVVDDPDTSSILIGSQSVPPHALTVDDNDLWTFGVLDFAVSLANSSAQPFYNYYPGTTITPSDRSGVVTVTCSDPVFSPLHVGTRIQYTGRELLITVFQSPTSVIANVVETLPPTYNFVVSDLFGYQVGDAVEHNTLGGQGVITDIVGNVIVVLATALWDGFDGTGKLIAPNASSNITVINIVPPTRTFLWEQQIISPVVGYAGYAAKHQGRLYLCDFAKAPQVYAASAAGLIDNFSAGGNDGDGFVESIGVNRGGSLKFILSAEDLLFFTTGGLFYQPTRDGSDVTPLTIAPIRFSPIGVSNVQPVVVDEGAVFVEAVSKQIYAATLSGDVRRSWRADNIGVFHSHLIKTPSFLGVQFVGLDRPETFVFAVNEDGTVAVGQWNRADSSIGFRPWSTNGEFRSVYSAFGRSLCIVDRVVDGAPRRFYERFQDGLMMDCCAALSVDGQNLTGQIGQDSFAGTSKGATHLIGEAATVYFEGWDIGDLQLMPDGRPVGPNSQALEFPNYEGIAQIGLPFNFRFTPWSMRSVNTQRGTRQVKRTISLSFLVQDTISFNFNGQDFGGYRVGQDLTQPPDLKSTEVRFTIGGREAYEKRTVTLPRPGPIRILAVKHKVTI